MNVRYLEPRTDVPAKDDWSTRLALADVRIGKKHRVDLVVLSVTFVATFFLPDSTGNTAARIVLAVLLVMSLAGLLPGRRTRHALRRGLFDEPWRRVPAKVAEKPENDLGQRLLLDGLVLRIQSDEPMDVVRERQEVFVLGPGTDGRALVRAAGSTSMYWATVVAGDFQAEERVRREFGRPSDEQSLQDGLDMVRVLGHTFWVMPALMLTAAGVLVALSWEPLAPAGLVAAAVLLSELLLAPAAIKVFLHSRDQAAAVAEAEEWTPVPIRLLAWRRGHHVAGIADLPGGSALVRFPQPNYDLVANIAGTGVMWIAGTHRGLLAVGLPGDGGLMAGVVRPVATSDPLPWWQRYPQADYGALPR